MAAKKTDHTEEKIEGIENALSRTELYIEENQKSLTVIVLAIAIIVVGFTLYKRYIVGPKEVEAQSQMYVAEQYFEKDSFNLALNGDGNNMGFLEIIDEYGITRSANLANYYSGISYLHLGEYENAIDYLKDFDSKDQIVKSVATGAIGDAYMELDNEKDALSMYLKAAKQRKNQFTSPIYMMKAAQVYEGQKDFKKAVALYEEIKKEYPESNEAKDIDKYIARAEMLLNEN
ncbi:MAG: tetratricopeptide repeat protein [Bacteroidetes bacterium]|nr:MAG: tetratricopeptide repeat protein [Bacteroidota bacterium]